MPETEVIQLIEDLYRRCEVREMTCSAHYQASRLRSLHGFSFWDSLIVSAALASGCHTLLTEDMQHSQWIEERLQILNPLLSE
jgi:predicted nucleic acid-binding protein